MTCLVWALLLAWPPLLSAQVMQLPWPRPLGAADGLPTPDIRAVAEDATGYIWLASSDGLLRFDGQRFRTLHRSDGLPDADLLDLHIDAGDRIWLATANQGVVTLGVDRTTFERADAAAPPAVRSGRIRQVTSGPDGRVWVIGDDERLYVQASAHAAWQRVALDDGPVRQLVVDRDSVAWVISATRLWRGENTHFREQTLPQAMTGALQNVWADPSGGVEITVGTQSWALDRDGQRVAGPHRARTLLRSREKVTWQQAGPLLQWSKGDGAHPVGMRPSMLDRHAPVQIRQLLQDRNGDLWWVIERRGLWWLPSHWQQFTLMPTVGCTVRDHGIHPVRALAASGLHHAWVAGADGLLQRLDLRNGQTSHPLTLAAAGMRPASFALDEDALGRVWVAMPGQLLRYDRRSRVTRRWLFQATRNTPVSSLQICAQGNVWLAAGDTVHRWSEQQGDLVSASAAELGLSGDGQGRQLLCTRSGEVWATDPQGPLRWSSAHERFLRVAAAGAGMAAALAEASDGTLWVSRDAALDQYGAGAQGAQRLRRISADQGFPLLRAAALTLDASGVVWAGATRGLVRVDPGSGEVRVLGVPQGLPAQEILPRQLLRLGSGALVAAVREGGVLAFDPSMATLPSPVPVLVVDAMSRHRSDRIMALPLGSETVFLSTLDRNFRVSVSLLGRGDPDRIQHRFRLLGQDTGWVDTGPVAQRIFARLPAGEHVLLIQARHAGGPWSAVRELRLRVEPRWWQTAAGRALLGVLGCTCVVLVGRLLHALQRRREGRRQVHQRRDLAELDSLDRTRFLARLGRQIRMPMTPVLGWSELLLHSTLSPTQRTQVGSLYQAGHHLLQLTDDALDLASIEGNQLHLVNAPVAVAALLDELHALLSPVASGKAIALHWHCMLEADQHHLGDVQRLRQILLNLLGNALKFTTRGQVMVTVRSGDDGHGLTICIADTGPGMSAEQVQHLFQRFVQAEGARTLARHGGSGLGLAISLDLVQAMGGTIEVDSQLGRGTRMTVTLPWQAVPCSNTLPEPPLPMEEGRCLRVMVLLPSIAVSDVVCALLRASGHQVLGVDDATTWLAQVDPGPWDLIAADPDMLAGGERVSARLPLAWPGVTRLALSPRADACAEREALAAGFDAFVRLPLTSHRLQMAVARCRRR
ncbi:ATP-binding protein [Stenotrophomonas sp. PS02289]|uniref:ATP-binding protein n=1 Tax=Stenotrophomonas sp. PS02289 TaxID=2991422 RepID=UPI00249C0C67|nr:ATP-binding protein [Stenotrophomonas sp. PS02289]